MSFKLFGLIASSMKGVVRILGDGSQVLLEGHVPNKPSREALKAQALIPGKNYPNEAQLKQAAKQEEQRGRGVEARYF